MNANKNKEFFFVILSEAEGSYAAMQCSVLSQDPSASLRMTAILIVFYLRSFAFICGRLSKFS